MLTIFKDKRLVYVAAGVSLLLQIISFLTTYQGAEYYFKGIFVLAPLLFAVSVQLVVYFLENSIRGRRNVTKIMALFLAMCCSGYFSYIGIYNNVNSPLTYYQETYTTYKNTLQATYDSLLAKAEKKAQQQLSTVTANLTTIAAGWDTEKQELQAVEQELNGVSSVNTTTMAAPEQDDYDTYEEYAKAYDAYVTASANGDATRVKKNTNSILKKYGYSDRQQVVSSLSEIEGKQQNMQQSVKKLCKSLGIKYTKKMGADLENIRSELADRVTEGSTDQALVQEIYKLVSLHNTYVTDTSINADSITQCITLQQTREKQLLAEYGDVSSKEPSTCKSNLQWEISKAVTEINRIYTVLEKDKKVEMKDYTLDDIYVLPILRLLQKDTRKMAWICLAIALLTDGLSLLFAMMFCPEKEILKLKTVEELLDRDEPLFERNIVSALQLSLRRNDGGNHVVDSQMNAEARMRLAEFLDCFETSSVALDSGYSLQAPFSELGEYQVLIALLCQLDLACILSDEEYQEVFGQVEGGLIVLLKTRFLLWCNNQWKQETQEREVVA